MAYRLRPGIHCVIVKNRDGKLVYHYSQKPHGTTDFGPDINWLSPEQRKSLVGRFVDEIEEPPADPEIASGDHETPAHPEKAELAEATDDAKIDPDAVRLCIDALEHLGVPLGAGAPTARHVLRDGGRRFGNDVIAAAVRERRAPSRAAGE